MNCQPRVRSTACVVTFMENDSKLAEPAVHSRPFLCSIQPWGLLLLIHLLPLLRYERWFQALPAQEPPPHSPFQYLTIHNLTIMLCSCTRKSK